MSSSYGYFILVYSLFLPLMKSENPIASRDYRVIIKPDLPFSDGTDLNAGFHSRVARQISYAPNTNIRSPIIAQQTPPFPVPRPSLNDKPVDPQEELLRYERLNQGFERMLQFVTIAGQIDSYLTDRAKSFINRLSKLTNDDDSGNRLQSRRSKCQ